jgi:hypothetical protein
VIPLDIQFEHKALSYLHSLCSQTQQTEHTQETRLPDGMPDIGRILGCWGQPVIRSKEWRSGGMSITGGIQAWVLYVPEEGGEPCSLACWIPFQQKWDFADTQHDGYICVLPQLKSMDARMTSARKLMLRANVQTWGRALDYQQAQISLPVDVPEDIQLLRTTYPMEIPKEFGEKQIQIDELVELPQNLQSADQILRSQLQIEITDDKILAERLVFRGTGKLQVLLRSADMLSSWSTEIPVSYYADLDRDYTSAATAQILPVLTNLETELLDGKLAVKAGAAMQYLIFDRENVELVEDAYSPVRKMDVQVEPLFLPIRLDQWSQSLNISSQIPTEVEQIVDTNVCQDLVSVYKENGKDMASVCGTVQMLYYDAEGNLQCECGRYEEKLEIPVDVESKTQAWIPSVSKPQPSAQINGVQIHQEQMLELAVFAQSGIPTVVGMSAGELEEPDPERPSVILCRCGTSRIWDIAKRTGSTVGAIRSANGLEGEPRQDQMLLIPIL